MQAGKCLQPTIQLLAYNLPFKACCFSRLCCSKIAEAEAAVSFNEKKWFVMHMHVQLQLDELRGPQTFQDW
jgi:hypothetical protein